MQGTSAPVCSGPGRGSTQRNELSEKIPCSSTNPFRHELSASLPSLPASPPSPHKKGWSPKKVTWKSLEWPKVYTTEAAVVWTGVPLGRHVSRCGWFWFLLPVPGRGTSYEGEQEGGGAGDGPPAGFIEQLQRGSGWGMVSIGSKLGLDSKPEKWKNDPILDLPSERPSGASFSCWNDQEAAGRNSRRWRLSWHLSRSQSWRCRQY